MYEINRAMERLDWETKKDYELTDHYKQRMIEEIKSYDRSKMFESKLPQKRTSFLNKILMILGYERKKR
jgi:hypothetical protein